jgi:hypothetical protein
MRAQPKEWLNDQMEISSVLFVRDEKDVTGKVPSGPVAIAKDVADFWSMSIEDVSIERSVIVVQGGEAEAAHVKTQPIALRALPASAI